MTIAMHAAPSVRNPGWFSRLRAWWMIRQEARTAEAREDDWTEPLREPEPEHEQRMRSSAPPSGGGWPTIPPPRPPQPEPVHPQFSHRPAQHTHVAIRMQRILVEASWDPDLKPSKLWNSMGPLMEELRGLVAQEQDQARRMERNQQVAVAQTVLLEDATLRGVPDEVAVEQAASGIVGRAVHVVAEERTGVLPKITEDTPDPRTVARPADENPGDVEPAPDQSPVHDGDGVEPAMPEPTQEFLTGIGEAPPPAEEVEPAEPWIAEGGEPEPDQPKPKVPPKRSPRTKRVPVIEPTDSLLFIEQETRVTP